MNGIRGKFVWKDGKKNSEVVFVEDPDGKWLMATTPKKTIIKYYIVYIPDNSKSFFLATDSEGSMLDHIMSLPGDDESDIGNYEIYQQII